MFDMHWSVALVPVVAIGVAVYALIARRHKAKNASEHILKL